MTHRSTTPALLLALPAFALVASATAQTPWSGTVPPPPVVHGEALMTETMQALQAKNPVAIESAMNLGGAREIGFDVDEQGTLWVRGSNYKASFGLDGATFIPFLGSSAPRNYPVRVSLTEARVGERTIAVLPPVGAIRDGQSIFLERGAIDEVYEIGLDSIEQTFVVESRPEGGDLHLTVGVQTELARAETAAGFEFHNERGGMRYGRASIRESDGTLTSVETRLRDGNVEIVVPASRLASATYPLVIDPVLASFAVDTSNPYDDQYPDVAYDLTNDRYLFVYQDAFSATDFDVYSRLISSTGAILSGGYVDSTSEVWFLPKVANNNSTNSFLVVATTGDIASSTNRRIKGRITGSTAVSYGAVIDISGTQTDHNLYPTIGGDPFDGTSYYCVGWQRDFSGLDQVVFRLVDTAGAPVGANPTLLQQSSGVKDVSVSNSNDTIRWNLAWDRCPVSAGDCDIFGAQVHWNGAIDTAAFQISNTSLVNYAPSASSPRAGGDYMVVWQKDVAPNTNIEAALISGSSVLTRADLTALQNVNVGERQVSPDIDTDGTQFVVGFAESFGGSITDYDPYVAAFATISGLIVVAEGHQDLAFTGRREDQVAVCSERSGGANSTRTVCTWRDDSGGAAQSDIRATFFDAPIGGPKTPFCFGDGSGTACPCGNSGLAGRGCASSVNANGALLTASGTASVSADTISLAVSGLPSTASCLFFQGTLQSSGGAGSVFGDGLRCATGSVIRLATKTASAGSSSYPTGADPLVSIRGALPAAGAIRYYQNWYRNSAVFCTASTFNLSNGVAITWLP